MFDMFADDLDEIAADTSVLADFTAADGSVSIRGVPVLCGDVTMSNGNTLAAYRDDLSAQMTVSRTRLGDFSLRAGVRVRFADGRCVRVTDVSSTPGDAALSFTVTA